MPLLGWLGLGSLAGRWGTAFELAARPLGEWDLVLGGVGVHRWLLLASALPALALSLVGFTSHRLRPWIGGLALGSLALVVQLLVSGDAAFVAGGMLGKLWLAGNAVVCAAARASRLRRQAGVGVSDADGVRLSGANGAGLGRERQGLGRERQGRLRSRTTRLWTRTPRGCGREPPFGQPPLPAG